MNRDNNSQKITMHDVAKLCGVSYQTVSRVINDSPDVAIKTRRLVLKAIKSLGYHPNQLARSLKTRRSFIIEVITFGVETYIPRELIITMGRAAIQQGYSLIFTDIPRDDTQEENRLLSHLNSGLVDGAIITAPVKSQLFDNLCAEPPPLPIIQIRNPRGSTAASVSIDQYHGGQLAVQHLLKLGHRQIAEISGPLDYHEAHTRHTACLEALQTAGLAPVEVVEATEWMPQEGYQAAQALLAGGKAFSGLVIANDYLALGAIMALREHGLEVPRDVSVVGFDDAPDSAYYCPPLTTIKQDYDALGNQTIHYLVELIKNQDTPAHQRVLMPQLIVRQSTRSIA